MVENSYQNEIELQNLLHFRLFTSRAVFCFGFFFCSCAVCESQFFVLAARFGGIISQVQIIIINTIEQDWCSELSFNATVIESSGVSL